MKDFKRSTSILREHLRLALFAIFLLSMTTTAALAATLSVEEVKAMIQSGNVTDPQVSKALSSFTSKEVSDILQDARYSSWGNPTGLSNDQVAALLKSSVPIDQVGAILIDAGFPTGIFEAILGGGQFTTDEIKAALNGSGLSQSAINQYLKDLGISTTVAPPPVVSGGGSGGGKTSFGSCALCDVESNTQQTQFLTDYNRKSHETTRRIINDYTDEQFEKHKRWMVDTFFIKHILTAMAKMTDQLASTAMMQMMAVGAFFDAKHQLETERLFQQLAAKAHKDYHPSEGMCSIGTATISLANAENNANLTSLTLGKRSMQRQLMTVNGLGTEGESSDRGRIAQFRKTYCNKYDDDNNLTNLCDAAVTSERQNKDIDYTRTFGLPMTLDVNFANGTTATADEADLLALKTNLYANTLFDAQFSAGQIKQDATPTSSQKAFLQAYLDMRSIVAKRGVAENSFNEQAGMKAAGSGDATQTAKYIGAAIKALNPGMTDEQAKQIVGSNPSYYAQMEVLTKKLLQDPQFYTDLYDKPANVVRKGVALQAIASIQERDNYKVALRSEMLWSQLLELKLIDAQVEVQNDISGKE